MITQNFIMPPEGTSDGILKSHRPSLCPSVRPSVHRLQIVSQRYLINYGSKFDETSQKIKHNEKVCRAHDLGSYAQGQGRNQVKGQNLVSARTQKLLKQI